MEKPKFVYVTYISSTPEKIFEALTQPEFTERYWGGHRIQSAWTKGAPVQFSKPDGGISLKGEVLQYDPPRVLCYTWCPAPDGPADQDTCVTFELEMEHDVTKLTTTHDGFESATNFFTRISSGWPLVLSSLKTMLESGKAIPYRKICS